MKLAVTSTPGLWVGASSVTVCYGFWRNLEPVPLVTKNAQIKKERREKEKMEKRKRKEPSFSPTPQCGAITCMESAEICRNSDLNDVSFDLLHVHPFVVQKSSETLMWFDFPASVWDLYTYNMGCMRRQWVIPGLLGRGDAHGPGSRSGSRMGMEFPFQSRRAPIYRVKIHWK